MLDALEMLDTLIHLSGTPVLAEGRALMSLIFKRILLDNYCAMWIKFNNPADTLITMEGAKPSGAVLTKTTILTQH